MMRVNLIDRSNPAFFTTVIANAWEGPQSEWQSGQKEGDMAGRGKFNAAMKEIEELQREKADLEAENASLRADVQSLANRLADCSECLGRAAERKGCRCHEYFKQAGSVNA
jgi:predicted nuclease with TOPRIM domain